MTLYYEDVPADDNDVPQLPPLLTAVAVASNHDVHAKAIALAASSEVGTVFYSEAVDRMHIAVVLSPEVAVADAGQMLFAMMIAAGDSIGALAPPEIAVSYQMPGYILLNKGRAGVVRVAVDPAAGTGSIPDWMVVSAEIMLTTPNLNEEIWRQSIGFEHTSLAEEGGARVEGERKRSSPAGARGGIAPGDGDGARDDAERGVAGVDEGSRR